MQTLQEFLLKIDELNTILNDIGVSMANGITTLSTKIETMKEVIQSNDFTQTKFYGILQADNQRYYEEPHIKELEAQFPIFLKELPILQEKLNFNFMEEFKKLFQREDFVTQWNGLTDEKKSELLYFDKEIYQIVRQKIEVKDFGFLFKADTEFDGMYPAPIFEWIQTPANAKVAFHKLRKAAKDTIHEEFFNSEKVKAAEMLDSPTRDRLAVEYLKKQRSLAESEVCWYDRLDMLTGRHWSFGYAYHFFRELEDQFSGYDKVREKVKLPDILKQWAGMVIDEKLHHEELQMYKQDCVGKDSQEWSRLMQKYPTLQLAQELQKPLKKEVFLSLQEESRNTEFESFFHHPMTEKMHHEMPYKREDYMFVYFRDKFINEVKKKHKPS